jgi:hypothetical protein
VVHARTIGKKTFTFLVSGKLWRNSLIMEDKETGSLWSHITGEALEGRMKGQRLKIMPSVQTTWARWVEQHPDTKVLRKERAVRSSRYEGYFKDPNRIGIFRSSWLMERMPGKSVVYGITRGPHALAIADEKLSVGKVLNVKVSDDPLVVFHAADGGVRAYLSRAGAQTLHFHYTNQHPVIKDKETGSTWDLNKGICIAGILQGTALDEGVVHLAFWFAWSNFYPNTEVIN